MKILFASSEYYPLLRTDDVADFAASLTQTIGQLAHDIRVILPAYPEAVNAALPIETVTTLELAGCDDSGRLLKGHIEGIDFTVYLIDVPAVFSRHGHPYVDVHGQRRVDNLKRFTMFSQAVTMIALNHAGINWKPDIVHCNDWQTGLVPALLAQDWNRPATVFSCHHLSASDNFELSELNGLKLPAQLKTSLNCQIEGQFSPLKAGLLYADAVTSANSKPQGVNADYLEALTKREHRLHTIIPAMDDSRWDAASDNFIPQPYDANTFNLKSRNKQALQASLALDENEHACLITLFGDLTDNPQNSDNIQLAFIEKLMQLENVQLLLQCRTAQPGTTEENLKQQFSGRISVCIGSSEKQLHRLVAGSDAVIFSRNCLLTRLLPQTCCRYGTIPMLSKFPAEIPGMIEATSENLMRGKASGFLFTDNSTDSMFLIAEKLVKYHGRSGPWWKKLAITCMGNYPITQQSRLEFTHQYLECYQYAIDNPASNPDQ